MVPKHAQFQIFIQANITVDLKFTPCQEQPHWVSGRNNFTVQRNDFTTT